MDRRILVVAVLLAALVILVSCSVVFEAGISGKVVTASGTSTVGVQDVNVFAYTDKALRDSDFVKFVNGTITRPTEGSGYVATTTTNGNGEFTVNKIVWETKKSEFGKTADVSRLYLIFYHEYYKPAETDATIISGSTNSSNVYVELEGSKDYTTLNITVYDVATNTVMTGACNLEYLVEGKTSSDSIVVTGTTAVRISYPKGKTPDVTLSLDSPGTGWVMTDRDGAPIAEKVVADVEEGTLSISLYMKSYSFRIPAFSGSVVMGSGPGYEQQTVNQSPVNSNDDVQVWLQYKVAGSSDTWKDFTETKTAYNLTRAAQTPAGNNVFYYHGQFSNVGSAGGTTIEVNPQDYADAFDWTTYTGKTFSLDLRVVFGDETKVREFTYTNNSGTNLGTMDFSI